MAKFPDTMSDGIMNSNDPDSNEPAAGQPQAFSILFQSTEPLTGDGQSNVFRDGTLGQLLTSLMMLAQGGNPARRKKHVSQAGLARLEKLDADTLAEEDQKCPICLEGFEPLAEAEEAPKEEEKEEEECFLEEDDPDVFFPVNLTARPSATFRLGDDPEYKRRKQAQEKEGQKESHVATKMPCGHIFGESCLLEWLKKEVTCPLCRQELVGENGEEDEPAAEEQTTRFQFYHLPRYFVTVDSSQAGESHEWDDPPLAFVTPSSSRNPRIMNYSNIYNPDGSFVNLGFLNNLSNIRSTTGQPAANQPNTQDGQNMVPETTTPETTVPETTDRLFPATQFYSTPHPTVNTVGYTSTDVNGVPVEFANAAVPNREGEPTNLTTEPSGEDPNSFRLVRPGVFQNGEAEPTAEGTTSTRIPPRPLRSQRGEQETGFGNQRRSSYRSSTRRQLNNVRQERTHPYIRNVRQSDRTRPDGGSRSGSNGST